MRGQALARARVLAAKTLGTLAVVPTGKTLGIPDEQLPFLVPLVGSEGLAQAAPLLPKVRMAELADWPGALDLARQVKALHPRLICALRLPLESGTADRILEANRAGVKVFHICADLHGRELGVDQPRHLKDAIRAIHRRLVQAGMRDEVTLIVSGGIALAEHVAKTIICGADLVAVDTSLLVALGCRVCRGATGHTHRDECPAEASNLDPAYAAQRMVNLMAAWHSQLIEVLGAMGIREVRRLRGEVGRAIFMEDIEREAFGDLACK
jgi:hypothetical protein